MDDSLEQKVRMTETKALAAVRVSKHTAAEMWDASQKISLGLNTIEHTLSMLCRIDNSKKLEYLRQRVVRLRELINSMELGSYTISMTAEMEEVWRHISS